MPEYELLAAESPISSSAQKRGSLANAVRAASLAASGAQLRKEEPWDAFSPGDSPEVVSASLGTGTRTDFLRFLPGGVDAVNRSERAFLKAMSRRISCSTRWRTWDAVVPCMAAQAMVRLWLVLQKNKRPCLHE